MNGLTGRTALLAGAFLLAICFAACGEAETEPSGFYGSLEETTASEVTTDTSAMTAEYSNEETMADEDEAYESDDDAMTSTEAMTEEVMTESLEVELGLQTYASEVQPSDSQTQSMTTYSADIESGQQSGAQGEPSGGEGFNAIGGSSTVNDEAYDLTFFQHYGVNPFIDTEDDRFSTFAIDVDTASYSVMRRFVLDGNVPDPDSVRVEEYVNYFDQGYAPPEDRAFAIHVDGGPSPFGGNNHWLMRVGLQGKTITAEERKHATLVFAIDVSGSMEREDRLETVKKALRLLVSQLRQDDEVGIVTYNDNARVLLNPTSGRNKRQITKAIDRLYPGGSTYLEDGLRTAYRMAAEHMRPGRITRVLLLSDGVGNVGNTSAESILGQARHYVDAGITLTTVGFGMGNYNDILLEQLANDGNGNYHYVDSLEEAHGIFVEDLSGTLQVIAKDTKVQVEFNPNLVSRYRLLGYENRRVADQDFRNNTIDAGEVGAGHSVTALYELKLNDGARGKLGTVFVRYEDPNDPVIVELERSLSRSELAGDFEDTSPRFQLSAVVAEYAEILRGSYWAQEGNLGDVGAHASRVKRLLRDDPDVAELADLVYIADALRSGG